MSRVLLFVQVTVRCKIYYASKKEPLAMGAYKTGGSESPACPLELLRAVISSETMAKDIKRKSGFHLKSCTVFPIGYVVYKKDGQFAIQI